MFGRAIQGEQPRSNTAKCALFIGGNHLVDHPVSYISHLSELSFLPVYEIFGSRRNIETRRIRPSARFATLSTSPGAIRGLHEAIVERIAGTAYGADRIGGAAAVERLAQAPDMDVGGALVD